MRYRELKVGMNIIGKPNNGYAITNQYTTCKVLKVNDVGKDSPCYKQLCDEYAKYIENMEKEKKV